MKPSTRAVFVGILATLVVVACKEKAVETNERWTDESLPANMPVPLPWFTEVQVAAGERLYRSNCAACHGKNAEGEDDWRAMRPDGKRPPPPLNGTADAWHHSVHDLRGTFMSGDHGVDEGVPSRQNELTDEDALAIIAWMQSLWPDEVYAKWHYRHHRDKWH